MRSRPHLGASISAGVRRPWRDERRRESMTSLLAKTIDATIEALLSRGQRARLARHLLNRALGEGDGDPEKNGEYWFLAAVRKQWGIDGTTPTIFDVGANVGDW